MAKKLNIVEPTSIKNMDNILNDTNNEVLPVFHFEYNNKQVRAIYKDGEIWFVAKNIAEILGYKNIKRAIIEHCKSSKEMLLTSKGGFQSTKIIAESDAYRLIFRSKFANVKKFEDWIVKQVLPNMQNTGRQEVEKIEKLSENEKRVIIRNILKTNQKKTNNKSKDNTSMIEHEQYVIWHNCNSDLFEEPNLSNTTVNEAE